MRDEEIDRILGGEEDVRPSSGFHASVMQAIHREATAPPPIPFPWKRAWPAFAAAAFALPLSFALLAQSGAAGSPVFDALRPAATSAGAPWIALSAFVTTASLLFSRRLAGESH